MFAPQPALHAASLTLAQTNFKAKARSHFFLIVRSRFVCLVEDNRRQAILECDRLQLALMMSLLKSSIERQHAT
ncbi:MAG TPA: hypothetical protein V6D30_02875 [Leptolyngbyaceae cyanobacterium]